MKIAPKPPLMLTLFNLPIFGTIFFLLYQTRNMTDIIIYSVMIGSMILTVMISLRDGFSIERRQIRQGFPLKQVSTIEIGDLICILPIVFLIFILVPMQTFANIFPSYQSLVYQSLPLLPAYIITGTLLTVLFTKLIYYYFHHTAFSGAIQSPLYSFFKQSPRLLTSIDIFTGLAIQTVFIGLLGIVILLLTYSLATFFNLQFSSGQTPTLLLIFYGYLMLPQLLYFKRLLSFLSGREWKIGHFYLLTTLLAASLLFVINIALSLFSIHLYQTQPVTLSWLPIISAWKLGILATIIVLAYLFASAVVRIRLAFSKRKQCMAQQKLPISWTILCISSSLCALVMAIALPRFLLTWCMPYFICIFVVMMLISCFFITGRQFPILGFLPNKNQLKTHVSPTFLLPTLQGIFILPAMYCLVGIYATYLIFYITTVPFLMIILSSLFFYWRNDLKKQNEQYTFP